MAKMTLLEMTQNILSAMNSDEVNSISDTVESLQVAEEIRTTYNELYSNRDIAEFQSLITLEHTGDPARPNTLQLPAGVSRLKWIKYLDYRNNNPNYNFIEYLEPEEFIQRVVEPGPSNYRTYTEVPLLSTSPITFTIATDKCPDYYTVFDGEDTLLFDSFDVLYESHLTGSNSLAWGYLEPVFELSDTFVPVLDDHLFPHFLAEAKSACFINIKEVANSKEEQRARRQLVRSQFRTDKTNAQRKGVFDGRSYARNR